MKKKIILISLGVMLVLIATFAAFKFFFNRSIVSMDGVRTTSILSMFEAWMIARNSSCAKDGRVTMSSWLDSWDGGYNHITKTWQFPLEVKELRCGAACYVDEETETAEINWMCTGGIPSR